MKEKQSTIIKMRKELEEKINQSTQVTTMKKMLQQKNEQIKELRTALDKTDHK